VKSWRIAFVRYELIIPNEIFHPIKKGLLRWASRARHGCSARLARVAKKYNFDFDTPIKNISPEARDVLFYGSHGEKLEIEYTHDKTGRVQIYKHRFEVFSNVRSLVRRHFFSSSAGLGRISLWQRIRGECAKRPSAVKKVSSIRLENAETGHADRIFHDVSKSLHYTSQAILETLTLNSREEEIAPSSIERIRQRFRLLLNVGFRVISRSIALHGRSPAVKDSVSGLATQIWNTARWCALHFR